MMLDRGTMLNAKGTCGCCEGTQVETPQPIANRPGLNALSYRVGTHNRFLETMKARLSNLRLENPTGQLDEKGEPEAERTYPLQGLTIRDLDDPSIALLDAWATVADVLTFYQERVVNEGYLRTATERRSVTELANLVGYRPRPGVASSVFLALEMDPDYEVVIQPYELKAQSVPGPGELPQTFENSEPLDARYLWNKLQPRLSQPQTVESIEQGEDLSPHQPRIYAKGITTNLKPSDVILITSDVSEPKIFRVAEVKPDLTNDRTLLTFQKPIEAPTPLHTLLLAQLAEVADVYASNETLKKFGISAQAKVAAEVIRKLKNLRDQARRTYRTAGDAAFAVRDPVKDIAKAQKDASAADPPDPNLKDWLTALSTDLNDAALALRYAAGREIAVAIANVIAKVVHPAAGLPPTKTEDPLSILLPNLSKPATVTPRNTFALARRVSQAFAQNSDIGLQLLKAFDPHLGQTASVALANVKVTPDPTARVYVFRATARPFGHNAPLRAKLVDVRNTKTTTYEEWDSANPLGSTSPSPPLPPHQEPRTLYLDGEYKIAPGGWIVIDRPEHTGFDPLILNLVEGQAKSSTTSLAAYGISGKSTKMELNVDDWFSPTSTPEFAHVRETIVYCESEELELAEEPIGQAICGGDHELIELERLYSGLQSGRWLIVSGEREDITDGSGNPVRGVRSSELVMLSNVFHTVRELLPADVVYYLPFGPSGLPGDRVHTFIQLATKLEYCYRRDTITIHGNVVRATHGETRRETLGSGDARLAFQSFSLKQPPLTYVASPTPAGAESTLKVYVNDVQRHETTSLIELDRQDRSFITRNNDEGRTSVVFGNGEHGARLPTGIENARAQYRSGIGKVGNVGVEQISQLVSKPLGVKGVVNPLRAAGGADRESQDLVRKNAPLTVTALDRLISVVDYADFSRTFAGIGKAEARRVTDGRREWVHVTIAGADDIPIDQSSDLFRNLLEALHDCGEPHQPVALQVRELLLLVVSANIRISPDYRWETVSMAVRTKLLDAFSFQRRELGEDVLLSEVIVAAQSVAGVVYVDVDVLAGVPEKQTATDSEGRPIRRLLTPSEMTEEVARVLAHRLPQPRLAVNLAGFDQGAMQPAQLAYLTPSVADTLVLNQIT